MSAWMVSANSLVEGTVVYYAGRGRWDAGMQRARLAGDKEAAAKLLEEAAQGERDNRVVDSYLVEVEQGPDGIRPRHIRERIRGLGGPTDATTHTVTD